MFSQHGDSYVTNQTNLQYVYRRVKHYMISLQKQKSLVVNAIRLKLRRRTLKKKVIEGLFGWLFWQLALTPYVILVIHMTQSQYTFWTAMNLLIVTPLTPFQFWL